MKNKFSLEDNLIITTKQTIDELLKYKNPADLISVYNFYYYTAKWQKTNQPKATVKYVAKGLKMSVERVRKVKKELIGIGLIEEVKTVSASGKITGWYIKLNYILSQKNHPTGFPQGGENQRVENQEANALSANSLNALSANSEMLGDASVAVKEPNPINLLTDKFKEINPSYKNFFANKTQRASLGRLVDQFVAEHIGRVIDMLPSIQGVPYATTITTPKQLEDKIAALKSFIQKEQVKNNKSFILSIKDLKERKI